MKHIALPCNNINAICWLSIQSIQQAEMDDKNMTSPLCIFGYHIKSEQLCSIFYNRSLYTTCAKNNSMGQDRLCQYDTDPSHTMGDLRHSIRMSL